MTGLMKIWGVDEFVSSVAFRSTKQADELTGEMMAAMEMKHELIFKNRGRVTQN